MLVNYDEDAGARVVYAIEKLFIENLEVTAVIVGYRAYLSFLAQERFHNHMCRPDDLAFAVNIGSRAAPMRIRDIPILLDIEAQKDSVRAVTNEGGLVHAMKGGA